MTPRPGLCLVLRAWIELARYDIINAVRGFRGVSERCQATAHSAVCDDAAWEANVCDAIALASSLYIKPVRCLQRSVCAVWLLRQSGIAARLVIGYRPVPFHSHAWVEVDGRVVNDSRSYPARLRVLYTQ